MNNNDLKIKLDDYKKILEDLKKMKLVEDNKKLSNQFNQNLRTTKTKKLVKASDGFAIYILPIIITSFIIGFAIGLAFAIYYI